MARFIVLDPFLDEPNVIAIAMLARTPTERASSHHTIFGSAQMRTVRRLSGPLPDDFVFEFERPEPEYEFRLNAWTDVQLIDGASYLLCLTPRDAHYELAARRLQTIVPLEAVDPLLLEAVDALVKCVRTSDPQKTWVSRLRDQNPHVQMFAVRALLRFWDTLEHPKDETTFDALQREIAHFIEDRSQPLDVRMQAVSELWCVHIVPRRVWPVLLIESCLRIATKGDAASLRAQAVNVISHMGGTALGGIPKQTYEQAIAPLLELFAREDDMDVARAIATTVTTLGHRKHQPLLDSLRLSSPQKAFYVSAVSAHWDREPEGGMDIGMSSEEFDYPAPT